ncbi:glutamate-1-semialdehyde 2,1-aminomutase [Pseudoflavonifractor phocaeensis]|uniref:glutamate-1-semialdehyde 2,1-aminomutase n=1 Tax=Pseudoflavonifractor phocaeensis TaxID=1870988 RepID=UPI00195E16B7|nr:glutamate-1-semialdehyde 2,1-aminomutase [Pseudoflavonifractor phocaeensis]MBM6721668.1 glutamate-1-semialdehyde 2,1-aminomutase [Pseudoflavonifractor phocaeensis]
MGRSEELYEQAVKVLPGGVNSPVRAYRAVGMAPRFITKADGPFLWDEDGKQYIDYVCSWGPMILGHNHPVIREAVERAVKDGLSFGAPTRREVEIAQLMVDLVPGIEMVRMVNSGTEAVMSAVRLARGATGRNKIIKFEGCYHGHSDCLLVNAGSSALAGGHPSSAGVPEDIVKHTLTAQFNDLSSVEALLEAWPGQVACIIVEPVAANMGVVNPAPGFLEGLRRLCDKSGALLIFDEVITGFRLALGGAQEYFGVKADLVTFGKIIGGGMPVGAYCGSKALMEQVAPCGPVYQAGTLSGNPVAMAAGLAQLTYLRDHPEVYTDIAAKAQWLAEGMRAAAAEAGVPVAVNQIGSLLSPFFTPTEVSAFVDAKGSDVGRYAKYFQGMLHHGIALAPAQFEAMFVSAAHTQAELEATLAAVKAVFPQL